MKETAMGHLAGLEIDTVASMLRSDLSDEVKSARFERFVREHMGALEDESVALAREEVRGGALWCVGRWLRRWWGGR